MMSEGRMTRKLSPEERAPIYALPPKCEQRHHPAARILFEQLPLQHRRSLLANSGLCMICLRHSLKDVKRSKVCQEREGRPHTG